MRRVGLAITTAAVGAFIALGVAFAQSGQSSQGYNNGCSQMMMGPMAGCPMGAGNQGMMGGSAWSQGSASISPRLDALHSTLAIRRDQQSAWDAYAAAARGDSQSMFDMHNRMVGFMQGQTTTAPAWLRVHRDMMRTRADSLDALATAVDHLYARLDAGQKANFDHYGGGMCGAW
jgi:hypothetical protein